MMLKNKEKILNKENYICACGDFSELHKIRNFVYSKAQVFGFDDNDASKIALAVDEACTNLIKHSFNLDKTKEFCVSVEPSSFNFTVKIHDKGQPFNPMEVDKLDMNEYFKNYKKCVFFQAEDGIRDLIVTGVQTCALPISSTAAATWAPIWSARWRRVRKR